MSRTGAPPIRISGLSKSYGEVRALDEVDLDIEGGEFLTLLGPSGSGKTTLLMALAGFARPDRGTVLFGDRDVSLEPPHRRGVGMVFQNYALFPHMTVAGNVGYPLRLRKAGKDETRRRVEEALATVELGGYGARRIDQLSGGQKQRVALARAIVFGPRILLMDEPLSALDKQLREHMQIELRRLHAGLGVTTVYVTHDQREALTMSDRIAVIDRGRLMQLDAPRALYERPANLFVADFIGESTFLPVERDGAALRCAGAPLLASRAPEGGGPLLLVLRPERLVPLEGPAPEGVNAFEAEVLDLVYQGDTVLAQARLANGTVAAVRSDTRSGAALARARPGERIALGLHADDAVLVAAGDGAGGARRAPRGGAA